MKKYFSYSHLPAFLQAISKPFCDVSQDLTIGNIDRLIATVSSFKSNDLNETDQCINKLLQAKKNIKSDKAIRLLLEAKDCAVRAAIS